MLCPGIIDCSCRVGFNCTRAHLLLLQSLGGISTHPLASVLDPAALLSKDTLKLRLVQQEVSLGILGIIQLPQSCSKEELCRAVLTRQRRSLLPAEQHQIWNGSTSSAIPNCCTPKACPQLSMKSFQHS